jgi:transposase|tara:strand:+ start:760 stop:1965 length:1206 start_codon:yes stop_codon:yes gene_type:complete
MGRKESKSSAYRIKVSSEYGDKSREDILDELIDSKIELEKLKRKLRRYENPHTPPSKEVRKNRTNFVSKTGLAVGKKTGYKGATRKLKEPNSFINNFDCVCSQCGKHNKPHKIKSKIYEEIPDPQPIKTIKAEWGYYECSCGYCWESKPIEVPDKGLFGKNMQSQITLLRFDDRLPLRKTISAIERQYKTTLTSKAVYDVTKRVADKITPEYKIIMRRIRRTTYLHIDETKIKIQGKTHWLWIFRSRKNIFFVIHKKRNRTVLDEILGYKYHGIIICDGLSAYEAYTKFLQRCWAHILRETKEMAEKHDDAKPLHQWMERLFVIVKSASVKNHRSIDRWHDARASSQLDGPVVLEHAQEYITFQYMIVDFVHWSIDQWYIPDILKILQKKDKKCTINVFRK